MKKETIEAFLFAVGWPLLIGGIYCFGGFAALAAAIGFCCLYASFELFKERKDNEGCT